jgi:hypothetical protein
MKIDKKISFKFTNDEIQEALVILLKEKYKIQLSENSTININFVECLENEDDCICDGAILQSIGSNEEFEV